MCGIAGIYLRDPSLDVDMDAITSTLLEEIEKRGQHATGVVALDPSGVAEWQKAACDATTFNEYRRIIPETTRVVLAHTRWATQGLPAFMENNHPIRRGPFYIIHNGHVGNDDELFRKAKRHRFGEVDSEAIAAHLSSLGDLSFLPEVMEEIDGDAAVAAVDERDCSRLALARGRSSPLWVYSGKKVVIFASTKEAVEKAHKKHIGKLSDKRFFFVREGVFMEWHNDDDLISKEFEFKKYKWSYTPAASSWSGYTREGGFNDYGYSWERSLDSQLGAIEERSLSSRDDDDEDTVSCDECGFNVSWLDAEYRYVRDHGVSFILCEGCAEVWDEEGWIDDPKAMWEDDGAIAWKDDDDDDVDDEGFKLRIFDPDLNDFDPEIVEGEGEEIIDDYAGANASIIRTLTHRIMRGGL
jgi:predicted glutamine amidotransferase